MLLDSPTLFVCREYTKPNSVSMSARTRWWAQTTLWEDCLVEVVNRTSTRFDPVSASVSHSSDFTAFEWILTPQRDRTEST